MLDHGLDPQAALDLPRLFAYEGAVEIERGLPEAASAALRRRGHRLAPAEPPMAAARPSGSTTPTEHWSPAPTPARTAWPSATEAPPGRGGSGRLTPAAEGALGHVAKEGDVGVDAAPGVLHALAREDRGGAARALEGAAVLMEPVELQTSIPKASRRSGETMQRRPSVWWRKSSMGGQIERHCRASSASSPSTRPSRCRSRARARRSARARRRSSAPRLPLPAVEPVPDRAHILLGRVEFGHLRSLLVRRVPVYDGSQNREERLHAHHRP